MYRRLLLMDTPRTKSLFDWLNGKIFNRDKRAPENVPADKNNDEDVEDFIRAFNEVSMREDSDTEDEDGTVAPAAAAVVPETQNEAAAQTGRVIRPRQKRGTAKA